MTVRESLLAVLLSPPAPVDLSAWGLTGVFVKSFMGDDLDAWEYELAKRRGKNEEDIFDNRGMRSALIAIAACDESGAALFASPEEVRLPAKVANAIYRAAIKHNGLFEKDDDAKKN